MRSAEVRAAGLNPDSIAVPARLFANLLAWITASACERRAPTTRPVHGEKRGHWPSRTRSEIAMSAAAPPAGRRDTRPETLTSGGPTMGVRAITPGLSLRLDEERGSRQVGVARELAMRGSDQRSGSLFSYVDLEGRVRAGHPRRSSRPSTPSASAAPRSRRSGCCGRCCWRPSMGSVLDAADHGAAGVQPAVPLVRGVGRRRPGL